MKTDLGYIRGAQGEAGPQGETGEQGPAGTVKVGSVTSASYGTAPKVTNSGTSTAAVLDFVIPQGAPGETVADVSELTANFITESTAPYPTYTTTEKMKVILGKIKKYLADLKSKAESIASKITEAEKNITNIQTDVGGITTALTGKLDKTDVIANLTATTSGKALDATQGKALQDQITQLNSDLNNLSNLVKKANMFKWNEFVIPIGALTANGGEVYEKIYTIPESNFENDKWTAAAIAGFSLNGYGFTNCSVTSCVVKGKDILYSVKNIGSTNLSDIKLKVQIMFTLLNG